MFHDEEVRLNRLRAFGILDTPPELRFDRITRIAAELMNAPIALVSFVDGERQWFKSKVGLAASETPRSFAFCVHAIEQEPHSVLVVEDASVDPRFSGNPLVVGEPGIRFYAGATLTTADGENLGTLCVIDRSPRPRPSDAELDRLRELAAIVVDEMELSEKIWEADRRLGLLKLSEAMSGVGYWRFDVATSQVYWSDQVYAIYGVDRDTFDPNLGSVLDSYHPDDRPTFEAHLQRSLTTGEGYSFQLRVKRADGDWRHVTAKAAAETNSAGMVIALNGVFQDVTEHVRATAALAESEAKYRLLAGAASDLVIKMGRDGAIKYASPSVKQFGWNPEDVVNHDLSTFIHSEDLDRVRATLSMILDEQILETDGEREFRIRKADGGFVWVEASRSIIRNVDGSARSVVSQLRDISERREATEKLTVSEARYRMIADNTTDIIGRVGLDGIIRYVSPAIYRLTGYTVEEMQGQKSSTFTHPEDVGGVVAAFREVMAGRPLFKSVRYRIKHKTSGEWVWVEANPRIAIGADGEPEFIDIMRDARSQVAFEQSMHRAMLEAEAGARAKANFLANMSHEIRTPLNGIVGYAAVLASSPDLPVKHRRHADIISTSSKALIRIVDDVLDFSALEENEMSFNIQPFDIRELLRATTETLLAQAAAKGIEIRIFDDSHLNPAFLGDDARIRQVLMNLIGNAIKFTSAGGVEISCEPISDGSHQTIRFAIKDTGIGIEADKLGGLFARFNQADTTISRRYGGSGLGLAITKKIVTGMGGTIGVESQQGVGSTFWFTLPLLTAEVPVGSPIYRPGDVPPTARKRILLVDDHDINRELGAIMLTPLGHEVVLAASGEEAVRLVEKEVFDLVFMDVQMPGMSGYEATRALREIKNGRSVPIVALTAHAMRHQIEDCFAAGMDAHVSKPFTAETLQAAIVKWANSDRRPDEMGSPEIVALRDRFVARSNEEAHEIKRLISAASPESEARLRKLIHQFAGTAGSLGFHEVGRVALAINASLEAGEPLNLGDIEALLAAISNLKNAV